MQTNNPEKQYLLNYSRTELHQLVQDLKIDSYRADQIFKGIYTQLLPDFSGLTTLSKSLRENLDSAAILRSIKQLTETVSPDNETIKFLWQLSDGRKIESVIIYEGSRITFCISSQVGCALDCGFCSTGKMGFLRNLSSGEIVEQVLLMKQRAKLPPTNIVYMGMGEPLLNLKNVLKAAEILSDPEGLAFSRKKITISTSGIAPAILKLADQDVPFSLAVSLNAVFEEKRKTIMPVSTNYPLNTLLENIRYYVKKTGKKITFEYIMIDGFNDTRVDADRLISLTAGIPCKINLIPCNSEDPAYPPSPNKTVKWFADYLHDRGRTATVRLRKGWEIQAACGQLYAKNENEKGTKITFNQIKTA
ncbi:MAG: 23S rRNA (adenine(2503)-C(2))-methyltransferase RlmN [Calditrichales bacterium]|nr:MAG: 23S rRNA (adenine(2503)-C(2))-methyltransferase RlmN [Calditrichales bacterium]